MSENRRDAAFILATMALPIVLLFMLVLNLFAMRGEYQAEIDRLEPRIARLVGLRMQEDVLAEAASQVDSKVYDLIYPATDDSASVAASLQKNVRDIFSGAGMTVNNSQILPAKQEGSLEHIVVKITATGSLDALDLALTEVASYRPMLVLESLDAYPMRGASARGDRKPQHVTTNIQVRALRLAP
nr:type II secretion system protein GspM [Parahaliea mediterranea]